MLKYYEKRIVNPLFKSEKQGQIPTSPKMFKIENIKSEIALKLNMLWHSRMPKAKFYLICRPCFAAIYENVYFASAMWSLPMAANRLKYGEYCLELRRLAISDDSPKNTASCMIAEMQRWILKNMPKIFKLISYQDTGVHLGTIYKASNWTSNGETKFVSWETHSKRPGKIEQSQSPKIRWEKQIRKEPETVTKISNLVNELQISLPGM